MHPRYVCQLRGGLLSEACTHGYIRYDHPELSSSHFFLLRAAAPPAGATAVAVPPPVFRVFVFRANDTPGASNETPSLPQQHRLLLTITFQENVENLRVTAFEAKRWVLLRLDSLGQAPDPDSDCDFDLESG